MTRATVKWYDKRKGWGIALLEDGTSVFLHYTNKSDNNYTVMPGDVIVGELYEGQKGLVVKRFKKFVRED